MNTRMLCSVVALVLALVPTFGAAQNVAPSRGWIGISFEVRAIRTAEGTHTVVMISDVNDGSPAREAGVRRGDHIVSINNIAGPDSLSNLGAFLHLDPGDVIDIVVQRDGVRRSFELQAAERVDQPFLERRLTVTFEADSMVETFVRAMDSLRVRMVEASAGTLRVLTAPGEVSGRVRVASPDSPPLLREASGSARPPTARWAFPDTQDFANGWVAREVQAPFLFELFRSEQHDSLEFEMERLNHTLRALQVRQIELTAETAAGGRTRGRDVELQQVQDNLDELSRRSMRLRKAMEDAVQRSAQKMWVPSSAPQVQGGAAEVDFRPLTPYLLGQNRAAGAEVIDLRPELAEYFNVDGGVLVVDVPSGTPAAVAGILPGDVITRIDQVSIRSVEDLRLGLSRSDVTTPITLIRQGVSRQVLLRR